MKFRRSATRVQKVMITLMVIAFAALLGWSVPELIGVFTDCAECTYSEWVWDQDLWLILVISAIQVIAALLLTWSAGHFIEGWARRRRLEKRTRDLHQND